MRPVSKKQNSLQFPLDLILGSEAQIRLLRIMVQNPDAVWSASAAAEASGISPWGTQKALNRLIDAGIVVKAGQGRSLQYSMPIHHALVQPLRELFDREHDRFEEIVSRLRKTVSGLNEIRRAWIESMPAGSRGIVDLIVEIEAAAAGWIDSELRTRLAALERLHDLVIEFSLFTRADGKQPGEDCTMIVDRPYPAPLRQGRETASHQEADERSRRYSRCIVTMMKDDPTLVVRAKRHVSSLLKEDQGTATADLMEWKLLLDTYSPSKLADFLISDTSRAVRLRQSSPFFAVLTARERDKLMVMLEKDHD